MVAVVKKLARNWGARCARLVTPRSEPFATFLQKAPLGSHLLCAISRAPSTFFGPYFICGKPPKIGRFPGTSFAAIPSAAQDGGLAMRKLVAARYAATSRRRLPDAAE
jgi:hypothetical protein